MSCYELIQATGEGLSGSVCRGHGMGLYDDFGGTGRASGLKSFAANVPARLQDRAQIAA